MKVKKISIKNIKAIDQQEVTFNGCTAIITGWNNKWKSTLLRSLGDRIRWIKPDAILRDWTTEWSAIREFTDWAKIEWKISDGWKEKFSYTTPEWIEVKTWVIRSIATKYFGEWFDIDKFLLSQPKVQKQMLQEIVWLNFDSIDEEYKQVYEARREANVILKNEEAKINNDIVSSWNEQKSPINVLEIQTKIEQAQQHNNSIHLEKEKLSSLQDQVWRKSDRIKELNQEIENLKSELETASKLFDEVYHEYDIQARKVSEMKEIDIADIQKEFETAMQNNKDIEIHNKNVEQKKVVKELKNTYDELDTKVKSIESQKMEMIRNANMPEWFEIREDWVYYKWFALNHEQLSSSSIYIASLKLASMKIGELQTLFFDASYLDRKSLEDIEKRAEEKGLQLLIERPDFDGWEIKYEIIWS